MNWRTRDVEQLGSVLLPGKMPPRAGEYEFLQSKGFQLKPRTPQGPGTHWDLELEHRDYGRAMVFCIRDAPMPPSWLIDYDARLSPAERAEVKTAQSLLAVRMLSKSSGNVLRDRKNLLRIVRAIMADDGVGGLDHAAARIWSRAALDDELCHAGDLDVESLYTLHAVKGPESSEADRTVEWLHTHGLAELGYFDFDILQPADELLDAQQDTLRAMAYAIIEGRAIKGRDFELYFPNGVVRLVEARDFMKKASAADRARRCLEEEHNSDRVVLCDPIRGLLGRWSGSAKPASALRVAMPDDGMSHFSSAATDLMAERARQTWPLFRSILQELAEFEPTALAKFGYTVDGANDRTNREHLWFEVHSASDDAADATLKSPPVYIARMKVEDRGWHKLEDLTDWAVGTPFGLITARNLAPLRLMRARAPELREHIAKAQSGTKEDQQ